MKKKLTIEDKIRKLERSIRKWGDYEGKKQAAIDKLKESLNERA